ncbi:MAG TPA: flavin reductase, partial [Bacillota bacterium]|nr:flavin reductase [Bacillota bacterium]
VYLPVAWQAATLRQHQGGGHPLTFGLPWYITSSVTFYNKALLKKAAGLDIAVICPLHGPVIRENIAHCVSLYDTWSSYTAEKEGITVAYTSVYGNTRKAALMLAEKLNANGCPETEVFDLARCDMSQAVASAFKHGRLVLATTTYNADIFPFMRQFIEHLTERGFKNRTVAVIENGTWAPQAVRTVQKLFEQSAGITYAEPFVKIRSALDTDSSAQLEELAQTLCRDYIAQHESSGTNDMSALFRIGYGLYVVTSNDGKKDNGLIVNTVSQLTSSPTRIAVTINKDNYSHHIIKQTGILNVNCLSTDAPFGIFERFGFVSGRTKDKFSDISVLRSNNNLAFLTRYINAFMSLSVEQYVDFGTHGMFICSVTEARIISDTPTMTYSYYQENVKPKPKTEGKKGFVCTVCGYVYEGDTLPEDFVCPLCKHGASDFVPIE